MTEADIEADQVFLWECCHRIKDTEASAKLILTHLGKEMPVLMPTVASLSLYKLLYTSFCMGIPPNFFFLTYDMAVFKLKAITLLFNLPLLQ